MAVRVIHGDWRLGDWQDGYVSQSPPVRSWSGFPFCMVARPLVACLQDPWDAEDAWTARYPRYGCCCPPVHLSTCLPAYTVAILACQLEQPNHGNKHGLGVVAMSLKNVVAVFRFPDSVGCAAGRHALRQLETRCTRTQRLKTGSMPYSALLLLLLCNWPKRLSYFVNIKRISTGRRYPDVWQLVGWVSSIRSPLAQLLVKCTTTTSYPWLTIGTKASRPESRVSWHHSESVPGVFNAPSPIIHSRFQRHYKAHAQQPHSPSGDFVCMRAHEIVDACCAAMLAGLMRWLLAGWLASLPCLLCCFSALPCQPAFPYGPRPPPTLGKRSREANLSPNSASHCVSLRLFASVFNNVPSLTCASNEPLWASQ
ncbi:hypothetical protein B0T17DRAFT_358758 [Bombardia bombarda]|uniref:Uncharacterized protein n=1 Tax=Bombardia bombarda TaxID=252184 RepID=A0AA39WI70_9PEZI|nr:hypothetical protein B0T17DRAFT_358758 [Bombardia bombarda]